MRNVFGGLSLLTLAFFALFATQAVFLSVEDIYTKAYDSIAGVFFADSVTEASLRDVYAQAKQGLRKVRILIVPGHDKERWGTEFKGVKEFELNLELAENLRQLLSQNPLFEVTLSQTDKGYDQRLLSYFENNKNGILAFIADHKNTMARAVSEGDVKAVSNVIHNSVTSDTALKLYGINKWANEQATDIVIHVHFNDYPGRRFNSPGTYSGFSVYVPENQFSNAKGSRALANRVASRLETLYPRSDLPKENAGVVEDQELIAIGANNTLTGAGMLIEYGYIYENQFVHPDLRSTIISDLAFQTYAGVMDFFGEHFADTGQYKTKLLPHVWTEDLEKKTEARRDVISLQAALVFEGIYPPNGRTKNDCGLSGYFGECTEKAVKDFQKKYDIAPAEGFVGAQTRVKLNELYGK